MLQEFKKFLLKGNLVEIAVGLILALAFVQVVNAFVDGIISPIIGAIISEPSFSSWVIDIGDGELRIGLFIDALINFVIVGFVLFLIVKGYNAMKDRMGKGEEPEEVPDDIALLREIRDELRARST